jgi:16S rRNA (uracil1498-N3)-methyltransferase
MPELDRNRSAIHSILDMTHRYFCREIREGRPATIDGPEAHHLINVMRATRECQVELFDGAGVACDARVEQLDRSRAVLSVSNVREVDRELPFDLTLATAIPKGDRQRWLVEKSVELGVRRLAPIRAERSAFDPASVSPGERFERAAIEASKQCGRNTLMELEVACDWEKFVASYQNKSSAVRIMADPSGDPFPSELGSAERVALAVGPEGGWTEAELALARKGGWQIVSLGPRILRTETAATFLIASTLAVWNKK